MVLNVLINSCVSQTDHDLKIILHLSFWVLTATAAGSAPSLQSWEQMFTLSSSRETSRVFARSRIMARTWISWVSMWWCGVREVSFAFYLHAVWERDICSFESQTEPFNLASLIATEVVIAGTYSVRDFSQNVLFRFLILSKLSLSLGRCLVSYMGFKLTNMQHAHDWNVLYLSKSFPTPLL